MKALIIILVLLLTGCESVKIVTKYQPIKVPIGLTSTVQKALAPTAKTATQKDVALYIIEQHKALSQCNVKLTTLRNWSKHWTSQTKHSK